MKIESYHRHRSPLCAIGAELSPKKRGSLGAPDPWEEDALVGQGHNYLTP